MAPFANFDGWGCQTLLSNRFCSDRKKKAEMIKGYSIIKQYVEKNEIEF